MPRPRLLDQFLAKCSTATDECIVWSGATAYGYGLAWDGHRSRRAHRAIYEALVGPIPHGLVLDHLCRVPGCVNPRHLEPVSQRTNTRRGVGGPGDKARQTHCVHGHEYTPENTFITARGNRRCLTCKRSAYRDYYRTHKADRAASRKTLRHKDR